MKRCSWCNKIIFPWSDHEACSIVERHMKRYVEEITPHIEVGQIDASCIKILEIDK